MGNHKWYVMVWMSGMVCGCFQPGTIEQSAEPVDHPVLTNIDLISSDWDPSEERNVPISGSLPEKYDLVQYQTPIRSQGNRGTCSIFASMALMEHLYMKRGSLSDPNFSEQYLQWAVKNKIGTYPNSDGSSAESNLEAIFYYGMPTEDAWPYETRPWNSSDDPAGDGSDNVPTKCYTNGDPP